MQNKHLYEIIFEAIGITFCIFAVVFVLTLGLMQTETFKQLDNQPTGQGRCLTTYAARATVEEHSKEQTFVCDETGKRWAASTIPGVELTEGSEVLLVMDTKGTLEQGDDTPVGVVAMFWPMS